MKPQAAEQYVKHPTLHPCPVLAVRNNSSAILQIRDGFRDHYVIEVEYQPAIDGTLGHSAYIEIRAGEVPIGRLFLGGREPPRFEALGATSE